MAIRGSMSMLSMFITNLTQFYIACFFVGIAEVGSYPSIILLGAAWKTENTLHYSAS